MKENADRGFHHQVSVEVSCSSSNDVHEEDSDIEIMFPSPAEGPDVFSYLCSLRVVVRLVNVSEMTYYVSSGMLNSTHSGLLTSSIATFSPILKGIFSVIVNTF